MYVKRVAHYSAIDKVLILKNVFYDEYSLFTVSDEAVNTYRTILQAKAKGIIFHCDHNDADEQNIYKSSRLEYFR